MERNGFIHLKKYLRHEEIKIEDIPLDLDEDLLYLNNDLEVFFYTPLIMYIIYTIIDTEMRDMTKHI